jgi:hypothetical protein
MRAGVGVSVERLAIGHGVAPHQSGPGGVCGGVRRALALGFLASGLWLAAPAAAQVVTLGGFPGPGLVQGPQLAGQRVAWSQDTCL